MKYAFPFSSSLLCSAMALAFSASALANPPMEKASLHDVTVFLRGAELFNANSVSLPAGESEVVFTNIANGLNEQSLQLEASGGAVIKSFSVRRDYLNERISTQVETLKKQLETELREQNRINARRQVIQAQLAVLESNRSVGGEREGATVDQVNQMLQLVSDKMNEALMADITLKERAEEIEKNIAKLNQQLADAQQKDERAVNQLVVKFYTPKAITSNVSLSYAVVDAGWVPTYDVRVDSISQPVQLTYKASVYQNSGIDWDNVKLTLSTGNPSRGAQAPTVSPWYIDLYRPSSFSGKVSSRAEVRTEVLDAAPPAPLMEMKDESEREKSGGAAFAKKSMSNYVVTDSGGLNARFSISLPYRIAADGKGHSVVIKQLDVQGDYRYVAVPKIEREAFLQVQLKEWESLNLLPGRSSVFYEGAFVGQGTIDPWRIQKTLDISLGRDRKVLVSRDNDVKTTEKAEFFGNASQRRYAYKMEMKNTRSEPIALTVIDQVPMSRSSDVVVDNVSYDGATFDKEKGEVQWSLNLAPNESRTLGLSYTVKYPKDGRVQGL
ncbi:Uncharacterized conserved protein [Leminorella richardii]|uniref:Uncharacterized conserved protein n=1 Tax=Leminorella richardii TaxID=158841 RepID=A0A2X4UZY9_9GAMM|nr:mucoidy inhibitor MuiA family protein [Leminorella richardii]SQI41418.1 Uncharacterized conserved protein [Leminorella richardii]